MKKVNLGTEDKPVFVDLHCVCAVSGHAEGSILSLRGGGTVVCPLSPTDANAAWEAATSSGSGG